MWILLESNGPCLYMRRWASVVLPWVFVTILSLTRGFFVICSTSINGGEFACLAAPESMPVMIHVPQVKWIVFLSSVLCMVGCKSLRRWFLQKKVIVAREHSSCTLKDVLVVEGLS